MEPVIGAAIRRHRAVSIGALAALTLLAWIWLLGGAGMGMERFASFFPLSPQVHTSDMMAHHAMPGMADEGWPGGRFALVFSMWWIMMVAMMLPSAAPMILLYARAAAHQKPKNRPPTEAFLAGYLIIWGAFSLLATMLHWLLERIGALSPILMSSQSRWLSAGLLFLTGMYQLSPLKDSCLRQCRHPAEFLSRNYRPGRGGALRMGALHGAFCVGCCWLLMALLFVGGVMNLAWIAMLSLMIALEKLLPTGRGVAIVLGLSCIGWSVAIMLG